MSDPTRRGASGPGRRRRVFAAGLPLVCGLLLTVSGAAAHVGDRIYPVWQMAASDLDYLDVTDGDLSDWESLCPGPSLMPGDLIPDAEMSGGDLPGPDGLALTVWLAYSEAPPRLYCAVERLDGALVLGNPGGLEDALQGDLGLDLAVDGDHSGGDYGFTADCCDSELAWSLQNNRQAQRYLAIADVSGGLEVGYLGAGRGWVNAPPFSGGSSLVYDDEGIDYALLELGVTPFDDLIWNDPDASVPSSLRPGQIIGLSLSVPDFDEASGQLRGFLSLNGERSAWRDASAFADARLLPFGAIPDCFGEECAGDAGGGESVVGSRTWGRIKSAFRVPDRGHKDAEPTRLWEKTVPGSGDPRPESPQRSGPQGPYP